MAQPRKKVLAHINAKERATWELNEEVGLYVGPSMKHYRLV